MTRAIVVASGVLCIVIALLVWSLAHPLRSAALEEHAAPAPEEVPLAARDVTPPNMLPGPAVAGPLTRVAVPAPSPPPPSWRRFFRPLVSEAGLIALTGRTVRLAGIAPLSADSVCDVAGAEWPCGREAVTAMQRLIRGRSIECRLSDDTAADPLVAPCRIGGIDLALWLAGTGWGKPDGTADAAIERAAAVARCAGKGLWRGAIPGADCAGLAASGAAASR